MSDFDPVNGDLPERRGFQDKPQMQVYLTTLRKRDELATVVKAHANEIGRSVPPSIENYVVLATNYQPIRIGEIDEIQLTDIHARDDRIVTIGCRFRSDGVPFTFEKDQGKKDDYEIILSPELPPIIGDVDSFAQMVDEDVRAFLVAARSGEVGNHFLDDFESQQLIALLEDPALAQHIDWAGEGLPAPGAAAA